MCSMQLHVHNALRIVHIAVSLVHCGHWSASAWQGWKRREEEQVPNLCLIIKQPIIWQPVPPAQPTLWHRRKLKQKQEQREPEAKL